METNEAAADGQDYALRFEDLTVDDDLPLLDRIIRYCRSGIALQRLVHVKMMAETAEVVGTVPTLDTLIPLLGPLVADPESVIRQHLAAQLLPLSIIAMATNVGHNKPHKVSDMLDKPSTRKEYDPRGYSVVTSDVVSFLSSLVTDADVDVRRSASESLAGLALHIRREDVGHAILPIPLRLANSTHEQDGLIEELKITAANLLAELGGAGENGAIPTHLVRESILPTVLSLCQDPGLRVRRAAAQALPRVLGGTTLEDAKSRIVPAFVKLSKDEVYRVRKSTGECLVDMSRSLMILAGKEVDPQKLEAVNQLRREALLPIAESLLGDANKFVRHGMMQFLGPFLASFYPYVDSALHHILPANSESDGSNHSGIVAQFFPHASSMVSRLNSSAAATTSSPTPTIARNANDEPEASEEEKLRQALPPFVTTNRASSVSLEAVVAHRRKHAPDPRDIAAIRASLLGHFVGLARVSTGDNNTDAEMRVYCAYSYPAVVLLLGPENWEGELKDCFITLLNPNYGSDNEKEAAVPPLPVKRCLASSLHTVAHVLGPDVAAADIMPIFLVHFLKDTDESVRLNMIRNFPTLLSLLKSSYRSQYLLKWCEALRGDEILGVAKRSATNPFVLNWRQRDYVSRSLPELVGMVDPLFIHTHLWPLLKLLLTDSISVVREDAIWAIPVLLKSFCGQSSKSSDNGKVDPQWAATASQEVTSWLKETLLRMSSSRSGKTNFSQRQLYIRICGTVALAIRFGEGTVKPNDIIVDLTSKFQSMLSSNKKGAGQGLFAPYQKLSTAEVKHLKTVLMKEMLPVALEFKDDRVSNVRLTLMKVLHLIPKDMHSSSFRDVLQSLEEEHETWETFQGMPDAVPTNPIPIVATRPVDIKKLNVDGEPVGSEIGRERAKASKKKSSTSSRRKKGSDAETESMAHI